jgi:hypothetical protein
MKAAAPILLALLCCSNNALALEKWGPTWSELTGTRYSRTTLYREPAIIKSVDGRDYTTRVVKIEPGKHNVTVQSPTRKGFRGTDREMAMDIQPCKRYSINAQFKDGLTPEWNPVVAKVDNIAGCKTPAKAAPAK